MYWWHVGGWVGGHKEWGCALVGHYHVVSVYGHWSGILDLVDGFSWKYGEKIVHYHTGNVGLQAQWLEAWWPSSDDEFAFVVEDDLEVSPLYYTFIGGLNVNYYYNESNFSPWVYGASLQRSRFVPGYDIEEHNQQEADQAINREKGAGSNQNKVRIRIKRVGLGQQDGVPTVTDQA
ncbi:hypothetical protein RJ639_016798 [Escallonia herrerae]|uniref:Uncharacterized protein n=1 Tax=Escallonia herrerae TaxID=1293975 RepID=A0AA89ANJ1_9ASTE|nr:hypothetical protein RJ639_016798 [Escallonia herrerae]